MMKPKLVIFFILLFIISLIIAGCGSKPDTTGGESTQIPPVISDTNVVVEGRLVPKESVQLAFFTNGQIEEILVKEGDQVKKGDIVIRLGNREAATAAIANAEAELIAAEQAHKQLFDNVEVSRARALQVVAEANKAVKEAQYQLDNFNVQTNQQNLTALEGVQMMKEALDKARTAFEPFKYKASGDNTREDLKEVLDNAQSDYNAAVRRLEYETQLRDAQAKLDKAMLDYEELKDGPDPDEVASADARVEATKAALESAKAVLDNLELEATIDGTVADLDLIVGQQINAGQPIMKIADFSQMYAETDDLTEIEVVDVAVGQKATVVPDAIPDLELNGSVEKISSIFEEKRGDITYTARILLDKIDPRLRWGMTVVITFEK